MEPRTLHPEPGAVGRTALIEAHNEELARRPSAGQAGRRVSRGLGRVSTPELSGRATVARLMREIEDEVREQRRSRLIARGAPDDYRDEAVFAIVEQVLRRAVEARDGQSLLLPQLLESDTDWELRLPLELRSHRKATGRLILFVKRRLLLPLMHWLYEYSLENFRRQARVNRILFASLEELAIEHAKLRLRLGLDNEPEGDGSAS